MIAEWKEDSKITQLRADLTNYFRRMAYAASIEINPTIRDQREIIAAGRVYEEEKDGRQFFVSPLDGDRSFEIDAFTKQTGLDFEITLLQILMKPSETHFPKLWAAYFNWMHKRADEKTVLTALGLS